MIWLLKSRGLLTTERNRPDQYGGLRLIFDKRRTRLADALKDFGQRVQLSVFECQFDEMQLTRLCARVAKLIEPQEDSVRIYRLCGECAPRVELLGTGQVTEDLYPLIGWLGKKACQARKADFEGR
jgi:CRISPR-associated protein Cas2